MENVFIYFLKVNVILVLFYAVYYFLLRKETFFQANRFFLLGGIISAFLIPVLTYSKVVFVEPVALNYDELLANMTTEELVPSVSPSTFDWHLILVISYGLIASLLLGRLTLELFSFSKAIQSGNKNRQNHIVLIESTQFESPFSFFNYLVYNKSAFTEEELQSILTHESVHINQWHSVDVVISKLITILLWVNPVTWFYRKAILQNLEFIADAATTKALQNTYNYQKTLLKSVCNQNQLSITNQFYQSLIKKRIVMLNTNPSQKRNAWKYSIILPVLVAFFLLYQVKTVAQVKESKPIAKTAVVVEVVHFLITKNTTDSEIKNETATLKNEHGIDLKVSKVKRNNLNEIIGISISYKDKDGNKGQLLKMTKNPIEPILFYKEIDENGKGKIGFGNQEMVNLINHTVGITWEEATSKVETIDIKENEDGNTIYIINGKEYSDEELKDKIVTADGSIEASEDNKTKKRIMVFNGKSTISEDVEKTVIFLNGEEISKEEMDKIDPTTIKTVNVNKNNTTNEIKIITKNSAGISDDTAIYINGKKATKEELDAIETSEIEKINIKKEEHQKIIEIEKKKMKEEMQKAKAEIEKAKVKMEKSKAEIEKSKAEIEKTKAEIEKSRAELQQNNDPIIIATEDGDETILFKERYLKIPGSPTIKITSNGPSIYVNGKKLDNSEAFLKMDFSKIYFIEATEQETTDQNVVKIKRIDVKTK